MKRLMALTLLGAAAATAAACVPGGYPMRGVPGPYGMARPYPSVRGAPPASIGVGRWDNVMLLPPATPVLVLMMDGRKAGGQFLSADAVTVKVLTPSGGVALAGPAPPPGGGGGGAAAGAGPPPPPPPPAPPTPVTIYLASSTEVAARR